MPTLSTWIGRLATNLMEPRVRISQLMSELGNNQLLRSTEDAPRSIWVTEDQAPNGIAGYYIRHHVPIEHTITEYGHTVALQFTFEKRRYLIRHGALISSEGNLRTIALMLESFSEFINRGFMQWRDCFQPFAIQEQIKETKSEWWRVLRLPSDATSIEIDKAYRDQARKHHPDRGGNHESFLRIQRAYNEAKSRKT